MAFSEDDHDTLTGIKVLGDEVQEKFIACMRNRLGDPVRPIASIGQRTCLLGVE